MEVGGLLHCQLSRSPMRSSKFLLPRSLLSSAQTTCWHDAVVSSPNASCSSALDRPAAIVVARRTRHRNIGDFSTSIDIRGCTSSRLFSTTNQPPPQQQQQSERPQPPSSSSSYYSFKGEKLRIAVVGGGCAGLAAALHLAPLVAEGLVAGPIDVFAGGPTRAPRDIGVGVWSTALDSFRSSASRRSSHAYVYKSITQDHGTWLGKVGYRTPDGAWLMKSELPTNDKEAQETGMPSLLFLRERDLIATLQEAVHLEQLCGTVDVHSVASHVTGLEENSSNPWSARLRLSSSPTGMNSSTNNTNNSKLSERDYHFIVSADGVKSTLRHTYGGYENRSRRLTGSGALFPAHLDTDYDLAITDLDQHAQAVGLSNRGYSVFRGNAPISRQQLLGQRKEEEQDVSFQTWGTGHSMRFATVPMLSPTLNGREEHQVWFITTNDDAIQNEMNLPRRKEMLLDSFGDWHEPIRQIVQATPAEQILCEPAMAHNHCMGPIVSFNSQVVQSLRGIRPPSSGEGPAVVFVGDAFMTVDPILAQGFTRAMEGAAALRRPIETSCRGSSLGDSPSPADFGSSAITNHNNGGHNINNNDDLAFDPRLLRRELLRRHGRCLDRLKCLLRSTALVEALGQPLGRPQVFLNTNLIRPMTRWLPNAIKRPLFNAVLRYSVGLHSPRHE